MKTRILSVTYAVISLIVSILSWWSIDSSIGVWMGEIGIGFGLIGLVIALVFVVGGIVSGVIGMLRNKKANETSNSQALWSLEGASIATCTCSFLIIIAAYYRVALA